MISWDTLDSSPLGVIASHLFPVQLLSAFMNAEIFVVSSPSFVFCTGKPYFLHPCHAGAAIYFYHHHHKSLCLLMRMVQVLAVCTVYICTKQCFLLHTPSFSHNPYLLVSTFQASQSKELTFPWSLQFFFLRLLAGRAGTSWGTYIYLNRYTSD